MARPSKRYIPMGRHLQRRDKTTSRRQTGPLKCRRGLESNDDSRLVQAMTTKTAKHRWVGQQAGGRPDDASSYEWVCYCDVCGVERNEDNEDGECDAET